MPAQMVMKSETPHNPLAKLAQVIKPSNLAAKIKPGHNPEQPNGHNGEVKGKATQRHERHHEEKQEKQERMEAERKDIEEKRRREDEEAARTEDDATKARYGELIHPLEIVSIADLAHMSPGQEVTFRGRVHTQRAVSSGLNFLLFREQTDIIQGVLSNTTKHMIKWAQRLSSGSIVQVNGKLQKPHEPIHTATIHDLEVAVESIHLVAASERVPWDLYHSNDPLHIRLSRRIGDLRHPTNQAIFRVRAKILQSFRQTMDERGFLEINTPKLQPAATESGAEVFKVNYFGRTAFLAQSPQLVKQMAISADFGRVYEIGPVFRAENSNTHRHLTEYTGLDIEMAIEQDYHEVMQVLIDMLKSVFTAVYSMKKELARIRERYPSEDLVWLEETPIIPFPDGIQMLRDDGRDVEMEDLSTSDEIRLGELVKEKYKTDFYVLDKFPSSA